MRFRLLLAAGILTVLQPLPFQKTARAQTNGERVVIDLPDRELAHTIRSQVAYVLINMDGPAIQPASRHYKRSWIRDGSMIAPVLLRMGHARAVREYIDWYAHFITPEGMVPPSFRADDPLDAGPGSGIEWDGQGAFVYLVMEYYRFSHDREFLARHYDSIRGALEFLVTLRGRTMAPGYMGEEPDRERFVGILPKSFSHEGYYPEMHSYWDDFWALKGWKDGADAAAVLGDAPTVAWCREQYLALRESLRESIDRTIALKKISYIPGCAEKGDFDPASTAIAFWPCNEADLLPQDLLRATFDRYYADLSSRWEPGWKGSFTPYEGRIISAFVALGQAGRANALLDYLMDCRHPKAWNHVAEVVLGEPRVGSYIGDMPHSWAGASLVNAALEMVARESGDRLVLLDGAPPRWFEDNGVTVRGLQTHFGPLDLSAQDHDNTLVVKLGTRVQPPAGFEIRWPETLDPATVTADERPVDFTARGCVVPAGTREIVVTRRRG